MTVCIMEQCLAAFYAKIAAIPDVNAKHNYDKEVVSYPTLSMFDGGQKPNNDTTQNKVFDLKVDVECFVQADSANMGAAKGELYAKLVTAVLADTTLGGVAIDVLEGEMLDPEIDRRKGAKPHAVFSVAFIIRYSTAGDNPYNIGF